MLWTAASNYGHIFRALLAIELLFEDEDDDEDENEGEVAGYISSRVGPEPGVANTLTILSMTK